MQKTSGLRRQDTPLWAFVRVAKARSTSKEGELGVPAMVNPWAAECCGLLRGSEGEPASEISSAFRVQREHPHAPLFKGWDPFRAVFPPPPPGHRLEIQIWSRGGGVADVEHVELRAVSTS